ncbi:MAG: R3H domain-containing nucleic acid-binding protein [Dehalococcoidia bacterium]
MNNLKPKTDTDLQLLIDVIPERIREFLLSHEKFDELLEVVLDIGRQPEARFLGKNQILDFGEVTQEDIDTSISKIGLFGADNRAGIERTLHRISAIRNRSGKVIGITFRVGRAVYGTIKIIEDLILSNKNVLLLGKPGVGKTTMLREVARVLADDADKRVIVVDTSNEIAGDGDIPHRAIGRARRMQVPSPREQHGVMIEAVENHMPEVIIIDEIGTELEANAARTIAERGVQLVATAHGNELENLIMNPTLSDLVGGIQTVTLGDIEAKRRGSQKTVLERNAPPTFDILVEIQGWNIVTVHDDVAATVDKMLRKRTVSAEVRAMSDDGELNRHTYSDDKYLKDNGNVNTHLQNLDGSQNTTHMNEPRTITSVLPYGVNRGRVEQVIKAMNAPLSLVGDMKTADLVVTTKNYHRRGTQALHKAEKMGKPVFVLRRNTVNQIEQFVKAVVRNDEGRSLSNADRSLAVLEAERAIHGLNDGGHEIELKAQNSHIRRLQHQVANQYGLESSSIGIEPNRRVIIHGS